MLLGVKIMIKIGDKCPIQSDDNNIVYCNASCPEWNVDYCDIEKDLMHASL